MIARRLTALVLAAAAAIVSSAAAADDLDLPVVPDHSAPPPPIYTIPEEPPPPPPEVTFFGEVLPAEELVYVIDVSGSMAAGGKLDAARAELIRSIGALDERQAFDLVRFGAGERPFRELWGACRIADAPNKAAAGAWVRGLTARGGTPTAIAVGWSLQHYEAPDLILLTDGAPSGGPERALRDILGVRGDGERVHCFGVDAYGRFGAFLRDLAALTGGRFADVIIPGPGCGGAR